jgi:hypothetical protein
MSDNNSGKKYKELGITLPKVQFNEIETRRGLVGRSAYLSMLLEKGLMVVTGGVNENDNRK